MVDCYNLLFSSPKLKVYFAVTPVVEDLIVAFSVLCNKKGPAPGILVFIAVAGWEGSNEPRYL